MWIYVFSLRENIFYKANTSLIAAIFYVGSARLSETRFILFKGLIENEM